MDAPENGHENEQPNRRARAMQLALFPPPCGPTRRAQFDRLRASCSPESAHSAPPRSLGDPAANRSICRPRLRRAEVCE
jgi:hypothetical protein